MAGDNNSFVRVSLTADYDVIVPGFYWVAMIQDGNGIKHAVTNQYEAIFYHVRLESGTTTGLPATAGTLTTPNTVVTYIAAVKQ